MKTLYVNFGTHSPRMQPLVEIPYENYEQHLRRTDFFSQTSSSKYSKRIITENVPNCYTFMSLYTHTHICCPSYEALLLVNFIIVYVYLV